jgi:uncharacterized alkaline shock family protein YloU
MKARSGKFGDVIMTILHLLVGTALIYGSLINPDIGEKIVNALSVPLVAAGVGAILILAVILRWIGGLGKKKTAYIDYQSEGGSVGISIRAIQDFIERVGREFPGVKSMETRLIQGKGILDIVVGIRVLSDNRIPELSQQLQQRIRESVRESLGLDEIGTITVQVKEIVGAPEAPEHPVEEESAQ